jgi:formylglycine-generating enzyme required for sulfatase activity
LPISIDPEQSIIQMIGKIRRGIFFSGCADMILLLEALSMQFNVIKLYTQISFVCQIENRSFNLCFRRSIFTSQAIMNVCKTCRGHEMKKCAHCRKWIVDDSRFCPYCGGEQKRKPWLPFILVGAIFLLLLVAGGGALLILSILPTRTVAPTAQALLTVDTPSPVYTPSIVLTASQVVTMAVIPPTDTPDTAITPTFTPSPLIDTPTQASTPSPTLSSTPVVQTNISNIDGMEMAYIPSGNFLMGSGSESPSESEKPQHTVYLDAFWMDRYEVTNAMYKKCVDAKKCPQHARRGSQDRSFYYGNPQYDQYPVVQVSWYDAKTYCSWAGRRLPSEAEWEKAARGDQGNIYPWGNQPPNDSLANFADKNTYLPQSDQNVDDGYKDTSPVGNYPLGASPYGIYDMAGNVLEWVADWYSPTYYSKGENTNPAGYAFGPFRVMRGGSCVNTLVELRTSYRVRYYPESKYGEVGFRCAMSP